MSRLLEKNRFRCIVCKKSFTTLTSLRRHRKIHSDVKPFPCTKCDKKFRFAPALHHHMMTHTGNKPYTCRACGKTFSYAHHLQRHLLWHTGEKPYACEECGKQYIDSSQLTRHMLVHTGEKPHKCPLCDKGFTTTGNLKSHSRVHTKEKPYVCTLCGTRFTQSGNLRAHMKNLHTEKEEGGESAKGRRGRRRQTSSTKEDSSPPCQHWNAYRPHNPPSAGVKDGATGGQNVIVVEKCPDCNKLFRRKPLTNTCKYCKEVFDHPLELFEHTTTHPCSLCPQSFCELSYLNEHVISHSNGFYHKCAECDRIFLDAAKYIIHMESHEETAGTKQTKNTKIARRKTKNKNSTIKSNSDSEILTAEHNYATLS